MKARLSNEVITKLKHPKNFEIKKGLEKQSGVAYTAIWYQIKANEWNGPLTREAVLQYLEEHLNMTRNELLEIEDN